LPERAKPSVLKRKLDLPLDYRGMGGSTRPGKTRPSPAIRVADPKESIRFIPAPFTNNVNLTLEMQTVLPKESQLAEDSNYLVFHAVGDTGGVHGDEVEKAIADAMDQQISGESEDERKPAFLYNLGDVIYFNGELKLYQNQFYEPFQDYHASIFAIPGNHDGDTLVLKGDPPDNEPSLYGFMKNFCDTASQFVSPYRATITQPYVYWSFETPLAKIVGLYSNVDGSLDARGKR